MVKRYIGLSRPLVAHTEVEPLGVLVGVEVKEDIPTKSADDWRGVLEWKLTSSEQSALQNQISKN